MHRYPGEASVPPVEAPELVRTATPAPGSTRFRGEIQALRAVAVAGVVLYHLWPGWVPGGFVGVDIFFVISGFLITQQLADELDRTGGISLTRFWARRIRRILPAAVTVLLASTAIVVLVMPRLTWQNNLSDIRAAAAYVENWQLGVQAVDYLAAENSPSLVQHYWSLSVEEQFYLGWPVLLMLVMAGSRRVSGARIRGWLVLGLVIATVTSLLVSVLWTSRDPSMAFFATPARAWEFGVGGLVAVLLPRISAVLAGRRRPVASWAGLAAIGYSLLGITSDDAFPGAIALIPVTGAALVIAAELPAGVRWSPARLTGLGPVQWLGDNSYSVYLWHWPLLIAAPWVVHGPVRLPGKLVVLLATLLLAGLSKRFIEDPVRTGVRWRARPALSYALAAGGVAGLVALTSAFAVQEHKAETAFRAVAGEQAQAESKALVAHPRARSCFGAAAMDPANHCARPYAHPPKLDEAFAAADGPGEGCLQNFDAASPALCTVGRTTAPARTVAIIGNSHAWRLVPALALYGEQHGWKIIVATRINCLGLITTAVSANGASANCVQWSAAVRRQLLSLPHLDAVVFPSYRYTEDFTSGRGASTRQLHDLQQQVLAGWRAFARHGTRVIVTSDVPGMRPTADPQCIAGSGARYDPCAVSRASVVRSNLATVLAQQNPGLASYLPLTQFFCDTTSCHAVIGGVVVYFDSHHLTTTYSRSLARYLGAGIAAALAKEPSPAR
jgi:peptidoglycan/LPS O-acetylase OafA/YrhL